MLEKVQSEADKQRDVELQELKERMKAVRAVVTAVLRLSPCVL